ncbi:MAG: protein kinase domain-containing protein [Gemmatimonadales bacterium]
MTDILERLRAALGERYAIERQAGEGGMATVWLARDLKHGRDVAVKVLRPELGASIGTDRFLREIELAAKLQHPHIVPVYDSGAAQGVLYYVMPFVEGESLRDRLRRDGALPIEEAQRYLQEVASALAYAHQRGIVHRDIKPENIMLSGGVAVVTDFGIARAMEAGSQNLTGIGMAIGTPAYMSPEQATAGDDVDARSDQYSLACVYYEMLTGKQPFTGPTAKAVMAQSLTGPRPRASASRQGLPPGLDAALTRGLASEPADRFPTISGFAEATAQAGNGGRRITPPLLAGIAGLVLLLAGGAWWLGRSTANSPVVKEAQRIAVLPFTASGTGVDVLGEGMVDLLATNLDAVGGISVVEPRRVLAQWRKQGGEGLDLDGSLDVGREVGAEAIVLGSIVGTGNTVRLSADLYAKDGTRLARAQQEGHPDSVLALVDRLSVALLQDVWRSQEPIPSLRVAALTTSSVPALRAYLEGERHYRRAEWDSAQAAFEAAIEQDSTFALAHYRMALTLGWNGGYGTERDRQATDAAARHASRLPERERALLGGYRLFSGRDPSAADTLLRIAAANPTDVDAWYLLGEARFHSRSVRGWTMEELYAPFDSVLALDSTLTPASIHPFQLAIGTGDSLRFRRYAATVSGGASAGYAAAVEVTRRMVWGGGPVTQAESAAVARSSIGSFPVAIAARWDRRVTPPNLVEGFDRLVPMSGPNLASQMPFLRAFLLVGLGRVAGFDTMVDSLYAVAPQLARNVEIAPLLMGAAPPGWRETRVSRFLAAAPDSPFMAALQVTVRLQRGEHARALRISDSLLALPPGRVGDDRWNGMTRALRGWALLATGDTVAGVAQMRAGLRLLSDWNNFLTGPVRLVYARALTARAETRAEAVALLRNGFDGDIGLLGPAMYELGRAEELAGNRANAAEAYAQFIRLWAEADSFLQPQVAEARLGLQRVTGEPAP